MEEVCNYFINNKFSNKEIAKKKKKIYQILNKTLSKSLELSNENIRDMFILYDHVFLFDQFYNYLTENQIKVNFKINNSDEVKDILGQTNIDNDSHTITIYTDNLRKLILNKYIKIGGIKCYDKLQCLMNVFEHELIHLLVHVFCLKRDLLERSHNDKCTDSGHSNTFNIILKNIFGHTQIYYLDLKKINKTQEQVDKKVNKIKNQIKINDFVESYQIDNKIKSGVVVKIENDYLIIKNKDGELNNLYFEYIDKF